MDSHAQRRKGRGAGRVCDTVGTPEVKTVGDASSHHVAQQAGEAALLPGHVLIGDACANRLHILLGQAMIS